MRQLPGEVMRGGGRRSASRRRARAPRLHLLDLGGTYGDPNAGDPIQYDELRIEHDQGEVEIVVYNRAILLFTTDSEAVRAGSPVVLPARRPWRPSQSRVRRRAAPTRG